MNTENILEQIGLSKGEIKIYLALLKLGSSPIHKIKLETKMHRTTIYDFLDKLINRGLVSFVIINSVNHYQSTSPKKLLEYVKGMEEQINNILPELESIRLEDKREVIVEVYRGIEGFKTVLNDMIRTKSNLVWFGVDEEKFNKTFSNTAIEQQIRKLREAKIHERLLTSEKTRYIYGRKTSTYKYVSEEYFDPTPTSVYSDKVIHLIWNPLTIILMKNLDLANAYRKKFEQLWKIAKKSPRKKVEEIHF